MDFDPQLKIYGFFEIKTCTSNDQDGIILNCGFKDLKPFGLMNLWRCWSKQNILDDAYLLISKNASISCWGCTFRQNQYGF